MHLVQHFLTSAACFHFTFAAQHFLGVQKSIPDALSHFNWQELGLFSSKCITIYIPCPSLTPHHLDFSSLEMYFEVGNVAADLTVLPKLCAYISKLKLPKGILSLKDVNCSGHCMFRVACTLGFFGFL